ALLARRAMFAHFSSHNVAPSPVQSQRPPEISSRRPISALSRLPETTTHPSAPSFAGTPDSSAPSRRRSPGTPSPRPSVSAPRPAHPSGTFPAEPTPLAPFSGGSTPFFTATLALLVVAPLCARRPLSRFRHAADARNHTLHKRG